MTRWTVYDHSTCRQLEIQTGRGDEIIEDPTPGADAITGALADDADSVALLRSRQPGSALVLTMHKRAPQAQYEPTGFLGVHDQLVLEQEPAAKKKWWQRIFD